MGVLELIIIAIGLAMDAFAVAICKGLAMKNATVKNAIIVGLWFGAFQAVMPLVGYFTASIFSENIKAYDHWVTFVLLSIIGTEMIYSAFSDDDDKNPSLGIKTMSVMALATSVDALAVGVGFAFLDINILPAVLTIGLITFFLAAIGVKIGAHFGAKHKNKAQIIGGIVLIIMGIKILLEHTGIINF